MSEYVVAEKVPCPRCEWRRSRGENPYVNCSTCDGRQWVVLLDTATPVHRKGLWSVDGQRAWVELGDSGDTDR